MTLRAAGRGERFRAEMSETAFGCVSMTELLSQPFILARFNFHKDARMDVFDVPAVSS